MYIVRNAKPDEFDAIGALMVDVYSQLDGFPKQADQPEYYRLLTNIGEITEKPEVELLVAVSTEGKIHGAVVYFGKMSFYGSGGAAPEETDASGFRLLAVDPSARGRGIGKLLTVECIAKARQRGHAKVVIHTTEAMQTAWRMYEKVGFRRAEDLDFMQKELPVFGFRLYLRDDFTDQPSSDR
ncbi:MAG: GNAT family N-acetyltransferase [Acidiferrobacterales bacterium]|nr:GNAT family N-acetyltransferase [Acidiferrobacterales bacterium]